MFNGIDILTKEGTREVVFELPGKLLLEVDSTINAVINTWTTYRVTKDEFERAVIEEGLEHAMDSGAIAWIVDGQMAEGAFNKELDFYIENQVFNKFKQSGIKYLITINSTNTAARINTNRFAVLAENAGLKLMRAGSLESAVDWLKQNISLFS